MEHIRATINTLCFRFVQHSDSSSYKFSKVVADIIVQTNAASRSSSLSIKSSMLQYRRKLLLLQAIKNVNKSRLSCPFVVPTTMCCTTKPQQVVQQTACRATFVDLLRRTTNVVINNKFCSSAEALHQLHWLAIKL